jgi:REP element-mobilizing transposase RayT
MAVMARKPRLHVPGGLYHVMLRGNAGQALFVDDEDCYHLYLLIQQGVERYGHRIHGFCCMTNHIHLAIQVAEEPLSRIMQNLSFRFTRWYNKRQIRTGHLFQGRYKAIVVDADPYLLALVRYIHLNPVRAGLVKNAKEYAWSGHRAYLGIDTLPWLETGWVLGQFAKPLKTARQRYKDFVEAGKQEGYQGAFHQGGEMGVY